MSKAFFEGLVGSTMLALQKQNDALKVELAAVVKERDLVKSQYARAMELGQQSMRVMDAACRTIDAHKKALGAIAEIYPIRATPSLTSVLEGLLDQEECELCEGKGRVPASMHAESIMSPTYDGRNCECPLCKGSGIKYDADGYVAADYLCKMCKGTGRVK